MTRVILVTGGSNGIGRTVAERFRMVGSTVVITGRDESRLTRTAHEIGAHPIACDATDPQQVSSLKRELKGGLDVLINMAGGNTDFSASPDAAGPDPLEQVLASWRANLEANLVSAVLTTTALAESLRSGGSIINIGSIGAEYASTSYGAAKAALAAWTAGLSAEVGPKGLTANTISPGYIEGTDFFRGNLTDRRRGALIEATHNGRPGQATDIAETAWFLASPGARHITGQTLHVNGGAHTTR